MQQEKKRNNTRERKRKKEKGVSRVPLIGCALMNNDRSVRRMPEKGENMEGIWYGRKKKGEEKRHSAHDEGALTSPVQEAKVGAQKKTRGGREANVKSKEKRGARKRKNAAPHLATFVSPFKFHARKDGTTRAKRFTVKGGKTLGEDWGLEGGRIGRGFQESTDQTMDEGVARRRGEKRGGIKAGQNKEVSKKTLKKST